MSKGDKLAKYALLGGLGLGLVVEYPNINLAYHTLGRDFRQFVLYIKIYKEIIFARRANKTLAKMFSDTCQVYGSKVWRHYFTFCLVVHLSNFPRCSP